MAAGYSRKTAYSQGQRLLKNVEIRRAVEDDLAEADVSAQRVLKEVERIAFADIVDAFNPDGSLRPVLEIPEDFRRALASIRRRLLYARDGQQRQLIGVSYSLRLLNKVHALELLGKYLKLWTD
jgi:phage terminase small subunit